ncbi:stage II sporulation protein M [Acaricomes phytoseiuli]|uniref:stage II sporulation protein M n=1 Tax=Acaricomes phytoseiuli TaxID=291968 RepID=UPI0003650BB0|nr:stage II sporulation protein M [Acaricomes phytoseiuli]
MDLDAFSAVHRAEWERLRELCKQPRLSGADADELLRLYQSVSTQLSTLRSISPESALSGSLAALLARARTRFTGARSGPWAPVRQFFEYSLPAACYRLRWLTIAIGVIFTGVAVLFGLWAMNSPDLLRFMSSQQDLEQLTGQDFAAYYSENPATSFGGQVWVNNSFVAAQAIFFGITGVWVPFVLYNNAMNIGITGGVMFAYDRGDTFFSYILPHGLMELTAIFLAAAAGLKIFWAWIAPGSMRRRDALAREGRALATVALGLVVILLVSGIVEAWVTPSTLPVWLKITIGAAVLVGYWAYTVILGGRAVRAGHQGDLSEEERGSLLPAA